MLTVCHANFNLIPHEWTDSFLNFSFLYIIYFIQIQKMLIKCKNSIFPWQSSLSLMYGSCHLDKASNVEIGVECQIFVIVIFFNYSRVLQFGAHSIVKLKRYFFSNLYYFQICFSCRLKKSKQIFNTKFVIQCSVQIGHRSWESRKTIQKMKKMTDMVDKMN